MKKFTTVIKNKDMFKKYIRTQIAEMREIDKSDMDYFKEHNEIIVNETKLSISEADKNNGSPKIGDMIARNPKNHKDVWLVAEKYFKDNFEIEPK